jgi:Ca2+-binding RTX toxin-like protein
MYGGRIEVVRDMGANNDPEENDPVITTSASGSSYRPEWVRMADGGRYLAFTSDTNPITKAYDPGVYVWDFRSDIGAEEPVGTYAKLLDLTDPESLDTLTISADGTKIVVQFADGAAEGLPGGTYAIDNPIWAGTRAPIAVNVGTPTPTTGGGDFLYGTSVDDTIDGDGGEDTIHGAAGDDRIDGGTGDDTLHGDVGQDVLHGNGETDTLFGGDDKDELFGDDADDTLWGQSGHDQLYGGAGKDTIHGGTGTDTIHADAGNDILDGGSDGDGQDVDVFALKGSAEDYAFDDTFTTIDGINVRAVSVESAAIGFDIVANVEEAHFNRLRTNVADSLNTYVVLAEAADHAYTDKADLGLGWKALSTIELGIRGEGFIGDSATNWTYENGHYSAIGPAAGSGRPRPWHRSISRYLRARPR